MKINMIGLTFMAIHLRQGHYQTYEFIHKRDMRYKIRDMQSGRNPLCQPGWIWCHESMCGMVGMWGGGGLIQRLEAGETLFGRHCLRLIGVEVEGRGCANSRADKREGTRGILLSYVSRQSAHFQQQQFACACVLVHLCVCVHPYVFMHVRVCVRCAQLHVRTSMKTQTQSVSNWIYKMHQWGINKFPWQH